MKTTALFLFLSLVMIGCKDEKEEHSSKTMAKETKAPAPEQKDHECLNLDEYNALASVKDKADWLRKYGKAVCDSILFKAAKGAHTIKTGEFTPKPHGSLKKDWNEINSRTSKYSVYDCYLSFDIDNVNKKIKDIKIVPTFNDNIPCYSLALFRAIAKDNNNSNITFEFIFADVKTETIIIQVTDMNGKVSYYDYSDEPKSNPGSITRRRIKSPL
jgi:hypothetical protein